MDKRDLAYTTPDLAKGAAKSTEPVEPAPLIGWRFTMCVVLLAAGLTAVGTWKVATVFELRDHEMEASRLQVLAQQRRDRYKALEARLSQLQGGESLRDAAVSGLGMVPPTPHTVESVVVSQAVAGRWESAAKAVQEKEEPAQ